MADLDRLSDSIRARRRQLQLTQQEVADLAEVSRAVVVDVESGHGRTTARRVAAICDVLGMVLTAVPRVSTATRGEGTSS